MPIIYSDVRNAIYTWAQANVPNGMPVIWYYPNAPRPTNGVMTLNYVTLQIISAPQIGWDYIPQPTTDMGTVEQVGDREFTLTCQAYGGDPFTVLENLRTSLQMTTVLDTLRANGIVFCDWYTINDITDLVDSRFDWRATMDLRFRLAQVYDDTLGTIAQVEQEEIIYNVDGSVILDQTVLIPPTI